MSPLEKIVDKAKRKFDHRDGAVRPTTRTAQYQLLLGLRTATTRTV